MIPHEGGEGGREGKKEQKKDLFICREDEKQQKLEGFPFRNQLLN